MFNSKELKVISTATPVTSKKIDGIYKKTGGSKSDIITDPRGQWAHPGEITKIPSGDITMKGVGYPILGIDNLGNQQLMHPGMDYTFPGQSVTEYPQKNTAKLGGLGKGHKRMSSTTNPFTGINNLMQRNETIYGPSGRHPFVPPMQGGGSMNDNFYTQDASRLRHDTPINFMPGPFAYGGSQLAMGEKVEKEHKGTIQGIIRDTKEGHIKDLPSYYRGIAKDHLAELSDYYTRLHQMEEQGEKEKDAEKGEPFAFGGPSNGPLGYFLPGGENSNEKLYYAKKGGISMYVGEPMMKKGGYMDEYPDGGSNPSPMNYGAFPVVMNGGEAKNFIHSLAKKQYGGNDEQGKDAPGSSIDSITNGKKNFFNNYIRNNVSKATAEEVHNELMQNGMQPNPGFKQMGGNANQQSSIFTNNNQQYSPFGETPDPNQRPWEDPSQKSVPPADQSTIDDYYNKVINRPPHSNEYGYQPPVQPGLDTTTSPYFATSNIFGNQGPELKGLTKQSTSYGLTPNNIPKDIQDQNPQVQTSTKDASTMRKDDPNAKPFQKPAPPKKQSNFNGMAVANSIIGAENLASHVLEAGANSKWDRENRWRTSGDSIFNAQAQGSQSRGDYDVNSGTFRPDQMVPIQFRGQNQGNIGSNMYYKQGGDIDNDTDTNYNEGDELDLSEDEIQNLVNKGYQISKL